MVLKKNLLQGFIWRLLFFFSLFLLNIAFSRFFGAAESGNVYFITNTLGLFLLVSTANIETGMGFYAAIKNERITSLFITGLFFTILSSVILFALQNVPILSPYFTANNWPWYYSLFFVAGNCITTIICPLFYAKGNYVLPNGLLAFFMIAQSVVYFIAEKNQFITKEAGLQLYFWMQLLQALALLLVFFLKNEMSFEKKLFISRNARLAIKYSLIALANNVLFFLLYRMDYWFVQYYTSPIDLGNYIQASKFGQLLLIAPMIFSSVLMPRVADKSIKDYNKVASFAFVFLTISFGVVFFLLLLFGPSCFVKLMGADYYSMFWPGLIKIPAVLLLSLQFVLGIWFAAHNKVKYNFYSTLTGVVVLAIADIILVPVMGINGAAIASLLAYASALLLAIYFYHVQAKQDFFEIVKNNKKIVGNLRQEVIAMWKLIKK